MAVTVRIPIVWRSAAGGIGQVECPAGSLAQVLEALVEQFPPLRAHLLDDQGQVRPGLNLFVNSEHVRFGGGLSTPLRDGDEVYVMPLVVGGYR